MNKITEAEAVELTLDSYLMQIHNTTCLCGSGERYGLLYEVWTHPTKTRTSGFRELRPARGRLRDLPIAYVEMPEHGQPVCSDCVQNYKTPTNKESIPAISAQAWAETLKRKYAPEVKQPKVARSAGAAGIPAPTADEL
jgi:hypothetical protein